MFEVAELGQKLSKDAFAREEARLRPALLRAQDRAREAGLPVVVVIAGTEGAGKGDTVNMLLEWMDARGIAVHAMGAPTEEETERPRFFRFWRLLPAAGRIAVFFGSWYTAPIVDRIFEHAEEAAFELELGRIAAFEEMLVREGVLLLKFWLHVTKKQQRRRFEKLEADPDTAWRVTEADWEFHSTYDRFCEVAARALRRTNTAGAPWRIVEAHDRRFRDATLARELLAALEERLKRPPPAPPAPEPLPEPRAANVLRALDLGRRLERPDYERELARLQGRLGRLARRLGPAGRSAVVVFEGVDAAGKGGCIRRLVRPLDARFYRVVQIAGPTDEERARPYLWRFWRHLPRRGHVTVYDRSWYGRVLVERVEGLCPPEAWRRAYEEINAFEEQLVDAGVIVCKFHLVISPEEQLRRFREREASPHKRYKITEEDWRNREKWAAYEAATCDMVEKTSTEIAPWTLVAAEDKRSARVQVSTEVCAALERALGPDEPRKRRKKGKHRGGPRG